MILVNLTWAQVNNAIETFQARGVEFNEPMCTDRENGLYEIEYVELFPPHTPHSCRDIKL